jgi:beta-lactamase class A
MTLKTIICLLIFAAQLHAQNFAALEPSPTGKQQIIWDKFKSSINEIDGNLDGVMGIAIEDLKTGQHLFLHENEIFPQASSIKIALLAELYHQAQLSAQGTPGKAKLTDMYTMQASDLVADSDIMQGLTPSVTRVTNRDLATMVVAVSDNSATNVLIDRVGMDNVNALMAANGLEHTRLQRKMMDLKAAGEGRENISTPREMMTLLESIYKEKLLNHEVSQDLLKLLSTHKDSWIPRDLPPDLRVANKPCALEGVRNDSGIVFVQNRPFVICVMTTYLGSERDGEEAISKISLAAYKMFSRLGSASEYGRVISVGNGNSR